MEPTVALCLLSEKQTKKIKYSLIICSKISKVFVMKLHVNNSLKPDRNSLKLADRWNEWDMRKEALKLSNAKKATTKSVQTEIDAARDYGTIHILRKHLYKGQLISKCPFGVTKLTKKTTKFL